MKRIFIVATSLLGVVSFKLAAMDPPEIKKIAVEDIVIVQEPSWAPKTLFVTTDREELSFSISVGLHDAEDNFEMLDGNSVMIIDNRKHLLPKFIPHPLEQESPNFVYVKDRNGRQIDAIAKGKILPPGFEAIPLAYLHYLAPQATAVALDKGAPKYTWVYTEGLDGPFTNSEKNMSADFVYEETPYENLLDKTIRLSFSDIKPTGYVLGNAGAVYHLLVKHPEEPRDQRPSKMTFFVTAKVTGCAEETAEFRYFLFAGSRPKITISSKNGKTVIGVSEKNM